MISIKFYAQFLSLAFLLILETLYPFFQQEKRIVHGLKNGAVAAINGLLAALVFSALMLAAIHTAQNHGFGLLRWVQLPAALEFALGFVLFDAWMYLWHRLNHEASFLWRFHRMHHADLQMDATTALRFHPGEILWSGCARMLVVPLLGLDYTQLAVYEICLQPLILFHHSNLALPENIDRILRAVVVTPNMHRVHHSWVVQETNSNYSSIFSVWDRVFRSFKKSGNPQGIVFGLQNFRETRWQTLAGLLKMPF